MDDKSWMTSGAGHPRRWAILSVLVVSLLVVVLDNTVLNVALPTIQADLQASQAGLVWSVDSYTLVFASLLFTWGVLGDRIGRKKVLVIGLLIFVVASAACAFAPNEGWLIALRAVMGIGGAAVMPTTLAIITVVFPPHERGKAIGMWAGAVGAAVALGPVLGGLLLQHPQWTDWLTHNNWGSVFLINIPIVAVGLFFIFRVVPESRNPHPQRLDLPGLVLSIVGLGLLIYGIINASSTLSWISPSVVLPMIAGLAIIVLFLWLESRSDHKSFDVSLFRNRGYAVSLTSVTLAFFALSGVTFTLPFYLQILRGFDTLSAGAMFLPFAVGQLLAAPNSARIVAKVGYKPVMTTGLVLVAAALASLAFLQIDTPIWIVVVVYFFFGLGMGSVIAPASTVMQNVLPLARAGAGSAVQNTVRQVGGALGVAIIGTVLATQYAATLRPQLPSTFTPEQAEAASQSIVATEVALKQAAAQGASPEFLEQVRAAAWSAFMDSSRVTYWIAFVLVAVAAVIVGVLLPRITPPTQRSHGAPQNSTDARIMPQEDLYSEELREELGDDRS